MLEEGAEVSQAHGGRGHDSDQRRPRQRTTGQDDVAETQQRRQGADLRQRGEERGDRRAAALDGVRNPEVGGHSTCLEQDTGDEPDGSGGDEGLGRVAQGEAECRVGGGSPGRVQDGDAGQP